MINPIQKQIVSGMQTYFELTQEENEDGSPNESPEWDRGYQAAMAIVKGMSGNQLAEPLKDAFDDGKNMGWNEAIEEIRLLRYAKEESADPVAVDILTGLLGGLAMKGKL